MWHNTLDLMAQHPKADLPTLQCIRAWVTDGVTLDLVSTPECVDHENTFSVLQEADAVRVRIQSTSIPAHSFYCPQTTSSLRRSASARHHQGRQEAAPSHRPVAEHERSSGVPVLQLLVRARGRGAGVTPLLVQQARPVQLFLVFPATPLGVATLHLPLRGSALPVLCVAARNIFTAL